MTDSITDLRRALAEQTARAKSAETILGKAQGLIADLHGWIRTGKSETATAAIDEARLDGWSSLGWRQHYARFVVNGVAPLNREGTGHVQDTSVGSLSYFDQREIGTLLAGLRHWQRVGYVHSAMHGPNALPEWKIATSGESLQELSYDEIDLLCDRIKIGN